MMLAARSKFLARPAIATIVSPEPASQKVQPLDENET